MKAGEEITSVNVAWDADRFVKEEKVVEVKKKVGKKKEKAAPKKVVKAKAKPAAKKKKK